MSELITKWVDDFPVDIYYKTEEGRVLIPVYRKNNNRVVIENYYCSKEFFEENLDILIPRYSNGRDVTELIKNNLYKIIQDQLYKNGYIVDEVYAIYVGMFIIAFHACAQLNYPELSKEKLEEWYSHIYRIYREAIPNHAFMHRR